MKLLLLHPLPLDGDVYSPGLAAHADACVAPTLYGAGDDLVGWARAALDEAGDGPLVVVGTSIGGSCAIEVARLAPSKVVSLVLCGAKVGHRPEPAVRDEALSLLAQQGVRAAWDRYWRPLFGPHVAPAVVDTALATAGRLGADALAAGVRAFHGRADRTAFLTAWPGRVAVVHGVHDVDPEGRRRTAAQLRRSTFHLVAGVGHYLPLEAPDVLDAVVTSVLADRRDH